MCVVYENARKIFSTIPPGFIEIEDLISEGTYALVKASQSYSSEKDSTFKHYVKIKTKGAMLDYLRKQDILPQKKRAEIKDFQKKVTELETSLNRTATEKEILKYTQIDSNKYREIITNINAASIVYIDSYEYDYLGTQLNTNPLESSILNENLATAISKLSKREQLILQLYYYEDLNFKDIAEILELSNARVSQIYSQAITHLKNFLSKTIT